MSFLENSYFQIALTFGIYYAARTLQGRTRKVWLNPILITIAVMIAFLKLSGMSYTQYASAGSMIEFWLQPAIVALGVPLFQQLKAIRQRIIPIVLSQVSGCVMGMIACTFTAKALGASDTVIVSLAPKSVTTPIAMEVSTTLGGIPSLTAAVVVMVGLFGALLGFKVLQVGRIRSAKAQGLSIGAASHALGTSRAWEEGKIWGSYSSLGLTLSGIITAILAPIIMSIIL